MSLSRSELEQAARKMFDAYAAVDDQGVRDLDAIISLFAPDVAYEMPFAPNPISLSGTQRASSVVPSGSTTCGSTSVTTVAA